MWLLTLALFVADGAKPATVDLDYVVPAGCTDQSGFVELVGNELGAEVTIDPAALDQIGVNIEGRDEGFELAFSVLSPPDPRHETRLVADSCETLVRAAALKASLALVPRLEGAPASTDPVQAPQPSPPEQESEPPEPVPACPTCPALSEPCPTCPPAAPAPSAPIAARQDPPRGWDIRAMGGGEFGGAGRHGLVGIAVGWQARGLRVELRGAYLPTTRYLLDDDLPDVRLDVQLGLIAPSLCLQAVAFDTVTIPVCFGGEIGDLRARGVGIDAPATTHNLWIAALARVGVEWFPIPRLGIFAALEGGPVLARPGVIVTGVPFGYRAGVLTARPLGGLVLVISRR